MLFSSVISTLAVVATVAAQTTHTVVVGGSGLTFTPNNIKAAVGDTVNFEFHAKNHTATQSTFAAPCSPKDQGIDSGYYPVDVAATSFPVWSLKINEATPLWFYCKQGAHCSSGMVMAINVNETSGNTFDAFVAKAKGGGSSSPYGTGASSGSGSPTGSATSPSQTANSGNSHKLLGGAGVATVMSIVGLAIGLMA